MYVFFESTIGREDSWCILVVYLLQLQELQFGVVSNGPLHGTAYVHRAKHTRAYNLELLYSMICLMLGDICLDNSAIYPLMPFFTYCYEIT